MTPREITVRAFAFWAGALALTLPPAPATAQVVLDGSFGTAGALTGPNYEIGADAGRLRGGNLFHSFSSLNLSAGETATFTGPATVRNILGRVTGGNPSVIDGTLRADITGANLFLLNPAGVIFGPNGGIDLSGSFAVTSADYLKLKNGGRFGVGLDPSADSTLTTGPIRGFGFLGADAGEVVFQGTLAVPPGKTITAVGGDMRVDGGQWLAPDGRLQVAAVQSPGEVSFRNQPVVNAATLGNIELRNGALVDVSGNGGGRVVIRGGSLVVQDAAITANTQGPVAGGGIDIGVASSVTLLGNGQITTDTFGPARGGNIKIQAASIVVDGQDLDATSGTDSPNATRVAAETASADRRARGGDVILRANTVDLLGGGEISTSSRGAADAGSVDIVADSLTVTGPGNFFSPPTWIRANASPFLDDAGAGGDISVRAGSVEISNGSLITADTQGGGDAGRIFVVATALNMLDGAITSRTAGPARGGAIQVQADQIFMSGIGAFLGAETSGDGLGGDIRVRAGDLLMVNDALISASTFADGAGGNLDLRTGTLELDGASIPSGIIAASYGGAGDGGDIRIRTDALAVRNTMQISTTSFGPGDGGSIQVRAKTATLEAGLIESASFGSGIAGGIAIEARQLAVTGGSLISVSAAENLAGAVDLFAEAIELRDSQVAAQAPLASGGSVQLFALSSLTLQNAQISASALANGGNISLGSPYFIFAPFFTGSIDAASFVSANAVEVGGNIAIGSRFSIAEPANITATGAQQGNVEIGAPEVDLSGSLLALPAALLGADLELRPDCSIRLTGTASSFVVLGRGGLPLDPGGFIPSATPVRKATGDE